jgi:hypothetical protein
MISKKNLIISNFVLLFLLTLLLIMSFVNKKIDNNSLELESLRHNNKILSEENSFLKRKLEKTKIEKNESDITRVKFQNLLKKHKKVLTMLESNFENYTKIMEEVDNQKDSDNITISFFLSIKEEFRKEMQELR